MAWFLILLLSVLPLETRSELYHYLPVFGLCALARALAGTVFARAQSRRMIVALSV